MVAEITAGTIAKNVALSAGLGLVSGVFTMAGCMLVLGAVKKFHPELLSTEPKEKK